MAHHIIYHDRDLDGECSAAIVYNYLMQTVRPLENLSINLIGADYGRENIVPAIHPHDHVYLVDFSFPLKDMVSLNNSCHLTWIDHHTSRLEEVENKGFQANAGQSLSHDKPAACELTWYYFFPGRVSPPAVDLIAAYDAWLEREDWISQVLPFQLGMTMEDTAPDNRIWLSLFDEDPYYTDEWQRIFSMGKTLYTYRTRERQFLKKQTTPLPWTRSDAKTYQCLCLNSLDLRADFWDEILTDEERANYDLLINYGYDGEPAWRVSLSPADRTNGPDCSKIAHENSGGGHAGRAGFCCVFPPFLPTNQEVNPT